MLPNKLGTRYDSEISRSIAVIHDNIPTYVTGELVLKEPVEYESDQENSMPLLKQKISNEANDTGLSGLEYGHVIAIAILVILEILFVYAVIRSRLRSHFSGRNGNTKQDVEFVGDLVRKAKRKQKCWYANLPKSSPSLFRNNTFYKKDRQSHKKTKTSSMIDPKYKRMVKAFVSKIGFSQGTNSSCVSNV